MNALARAVATMQRFNTIVRTHGAGELFRRGRNRFGTLLRTFAPRPSLGLRTLVVVDEHLPMPDRDGGSARAMAILRLLEGAGWTPAVCPLDGRALEPYASDLFRADIDVVTGERAVERCVRDAEVIWIARPGPAAAWMRRARALNPSARIVYDTVDLHHLRERRRDEHRGVKTDVDATLARETAAIREADVTIVVSEPERAIVEGLGAKSTIVIPTMQRPLEHPPGYAARAGLLFVGSFDHEPNIDAALYLAREIMPRVRERAPLRLTIAGSNPPPHIRALQSESVDVRGYVPDLDPLLRAARLSLAPLRFGAGLKAKITQAFGYGLPVVGTSIAAEGFDNAARQAISIANDPDAFADAILIAYRDEARWNELATAARAAAQRYAPATVRSAVLEAVGGGVRST
jgi:glycosyltransferase involved in cell wall biosynthesis